MRTEDDREPQRSLSTARKDGEKKREKAGASINKLIAQRWDGAVTTVAPYQQQ